MMSFYKPLLLTGALVCLASGAYAQSYQDNKAGQDMNQYNPSTGSMNEDSFSPGSPASKEGLSSEQIKQVQNALKRKGYNVVADGIWGQSTTSSLRSFQRDNRLSATGSLDAQTLAALDLDMDASGGDARASSTGR